MKSGRHGSTTGHRRLHRTVAAAVVLAMFAVPAGVARADSAAPGDDGTDDAPPSVLLFAADGLRQDIVKRYIDQGGMPGLAEMRYGGVVADGNGMYTQAPTNTGAGWYTMATGAWPAVTGSTNNTFHINGAPFANRTSAFDAAALQAETIAQSAERGGKKVIQMEWAGGRNALINGPTVDFRAFVSGRGVVDQLRLAVRSPGAHLRVRVAVRPAADRPCDRLDERSRVVQRRARDAHGSARWRRRQVRARGLHLRQHRRQHRQLRPGAVRQDEGRRLDGRRPRARACSPT